MLRIFKVFSIFLLLSCSVVSAAFDQMVVFGDSLSDNGNVYAIFKKLHEVVPSIPLIPAPNIYWEGRFSNGPVWNELLAKKMGLDVTDKHQYLNYAHGGAWVERITQGRNYRNVVPDVQDQVKVMYRLRLSAHTDDHLDQHLFLLWGGANDYAFGRDNVEQATNQTVAGLKNCLTWLLDHGARHLLVINLPDISQSTYGRLKDDGYRKNVHALILAHNHKLHMMLEQLRIAYPKAHIVEFSVSDFFQQAINHPSSFGLDDSHSCYMKAFKHAETDMHHQASMSQTAQHGFFVSHGVKMQHAYGLLTAGDKPYACSDPDKHLFFDKLHPSAHIHAWIARFVQKHLNY